MKLAATVFLMMTSTYALATPFSYSCKGTDQDGDERSFQFTHSQHAAAVTTDEGDEYMIDRRYDDYASNRKFGVFIDNGYDGYGGFVKLSMPLTLIDAEAANTRSFTSYFVVATYSELGHHSTVEVTGRCILAKPDALTKSLAKQAAKYSALVPNATWMSEADYGWRPFYSLQPVSDAQWNSGKVAASLLAGSAHVEVWSHKEVLELLNELASDSDRSSEQEQAEYSALLKALKGDFKELRGFKVGKPDSGALDLFIVGRTKAGYLIGIRTISVET